MTKHLALTKQGNDWFTLASDPFHDLEVNIPGYPDHYSDSTVVNYKKSILTVKKPVNLPEDATWHCQVVTMPVLHTADGLFFFQQHPTLIQVFNSLEYPKSIGTVVIATAADGVPLFPTTETVQQWDSADPFFTRTYTAVSAMDGMEGMGRLIAGGFEVHNDTPELFRGGSVTVYSAPQEASPTYVCEYADTSEGVAVAAVQNHKSLPGITSEAANYRNARTWEASQGCYVPFRLNMEADGLAFRAQPHLIPHFRYGEENLASGFAMKQIYNHVDPGHLVVSPQVSSRKAPLDTTGAFFAGLPNQTTLTVNTRFFTEVAPTIAQAQLLALATQSAPADARAIECYQHCASRLPAGVPVSFNNNSKWWSMVLKVVKELAPFIATGLSLAQPELSPALALGALAISQIPNNKKKRNIKQARSNPANNLRKK